MRRFSRGTGEAEADSTFVQGMDYRQIQSRDKIAVAQTPEAVTLMRT